MLVSFDDGGRNRNAQTVTAQGHLEFFKVPLFRYQLDPGLVDQIRTKTNGGFVPGSERFQKEIAATLGRRTWRGSPGRPTKSDGEVEQQELKL